ncbi:leucine-rich repeat-containing protein 4C-like [Mytilus trossulus]|uniref:leucine-rich repeat-containing protein 4C-like n=1 Tax=Mytilus trossulus TaxID=6551 RepID=UPI003006C3DA
MMTITIFTIILCFGLAFVQCSIDQECFSIGKVLSCGTIKHFPTSISSDIDTITIYEMEAESIPSDLSHRIPHLRLIQIYFGKIDRISAGAFTNLQQAVEISFFQSKIRLIETNAFRNITKLSVSFHNTTIKEMQVNSFSQIQRMDSFGMTLCNVTIVRQNAINSISYVDRFQIQNSNFGLIEKRAISNFGKLIFFQIHDNTFKLFKCMSLEPLLAAANNSAFYQNVFSCSCDLQWIVRDKITSTYLFSNMCEEKKSNERVVLDKFDFQAAGCTDVIDTCKENFKITIATRAVPSTKKTLPVTTEKQNELHSTSDLTTVVAKTETATIPMTKERLVISTRNLKQSTTKEVKIKTASTISATTFNLSNVTSSSEETTQRRTSLYSESVASTKVTDLHTTKLRQTVPSSRGQNINNSENLKLHHSLIMLMVLMVILNML